jgi:transcriptional regulator GlxA family with amidase domain
LQETKERIPFFSALTDSRINHVLSAIHANPKETWNVERLGQLVNILRSSLSNYFTELVNMTPLQYTIFVRLQRVSCLLTETSTPLINVAQSIGYQSEAAFCLSFKKNMR